jgi:bacillithiol biosynthesis deacetylase BshB1
MELDILAFAAHPDDVELAASGTVLHHIALGKKVGIVDLTKGELGTRGSAEIREQEAALSSKILGISVRENLDLGDGFFEINETNLLKVVSMIRKYRPKVVLCNALHDRHPDHGRGGDLVARATFLSGLPKVVTLINGQNQEAFRPLTVLRYIQDNWIQPDVVVDITPYFETKMKSILAFSTQFYNPNSTEPQTAISSPDFLEYLKGRAIQFGRVINTTYGEGFNVVRPLGIEDLTSIK